MRSILVLGAVLAMTAPQAAQADWGSHGWSSAGGSWSSHGSHGGWGSSGGWASHVSHGSHGSHGGLLHGVSHLVHRILPPYPNLHGHHSCGGSHGYHARSWGSHGGWGSSGGSWSACSGGSTGHHHGVYYDYEKPFAPGDGEDDEDGEENDGDLPNPSDEAGEGEGSMAVLEVVVPEDARVFVNGKATSSAGTHRRFVSRGLEADFNYTYEVRVEGIVDGETVSETKTVRVTAGQETKLSFQLVRELETVLTLNVPHDAEVFLGGSKTKAKGNVRIFRTKSLEKGDAWRDYQVRVVVQRNGVPVEQFRTVTVNAGEKKALAFEFSDSKINVASAR